MSFLRWFKAEPRSLLRELVDEAAYRQNPAAELLNAALLVRRAGLEHLVEDAGHAEVLAMAQAGELLEKERAVNLLLALRKPEEAIAEFDGGESLREKALDDVMAGRV